MSAAAMELFAFCRLYDVHRKKALGLMCELSGCIVG